MEATKNQPLLSIVVPVYNGSAYIDELFAQFAEQSMDPVELVFIDDGSKDDSYEKLLAWQKKERFYISVYQQENKGVSAARNFGVEKAQGKYLTFVDVDDGIATNYIAVLMEYAHKGIDVLVFDSKRVEADGAESVRASADDVPGREISKQEMLTEFLYDPTRFGVVNLLLRREYLAEHDVTFPVGYKYYEDYDYLLQVFAQTDSLIYMRQVLYYYILREGSAMGRFNADRINCLKLMKYRENWLEGFAPQFAPIFHQWGVARLYWSVLWQAALAFPTYGEFAKFAQLTYAKKYLVKLKGYPDKLLQLSTAAFLCCKPAYYVAVRLAGRAKSKVHYAALKDIQPNLLEDVAFY